MINNCISKQIGKKVIAQFVNDRETLYIGTVQYDMNLDGTLHVSEWTAFQWNI